MHDRDLIWIKANGDRIKIKDMSNRHLTNTLNLLERDFTKFVSLYEKKKMKNTKINIKQEIRYRKLNRLKINNEDKLF